MTGVSFGNNVDELFADYVNEYSCEIFCRSLMKV